MVKIYEFMIARSVRGSSQIYSRAGHCDES
jgi:hypothetical protein